MSMLPLSMHPTSSSSFIATHPLHGHQSAHNMTTTNISHRILSPVNYGEARKPPVVSPSKRIRKSRIVFDFSTEEMAKYFHMSQREAAQQLGVATVTIKRNCRRLGIVWPYRLMKSKKHAINSSAISCEDAQRIRQERALTRAKAGRSVPRKNCKRFSDSLDEDDAKIMTVDSHKSQGRIKLTDAGRAFARLPLDCEGTFL